MLIWISIVSIHTECYVHRHRQFGAHWVMPASQRRCYWILNMLGIDFGMLIFYQFISSCFVDTERSSLSCVERHCLHCHVLRHCTTVTLFLSLIFFIHHSGLVDAMCPFSISIFDFSLRQPLRILPCASLCVQPFRSSIDSNRFADKQCVQARITHSHTSNTLILCASSMWNLNDTRYNLNQFDVNGMEITTRHKM